jgi:hypothetical protein
LYAARLISHRRGRFSPGDKAKELFATAESRAKRSLYDQFDALKRLVMCPCCGVALKRVSWQVALTESDFNAAAGQYTGR